MERHDGVLLKRLEVHGLNPSALHRHLKLHGLLGLQQRLRIAGCGRIVRACERHHGSWVGQR